MQALVSKFPWSFKTLHIYFSNKMSILSEGAAHVDLSVCALLIL